MSLVWWDGMSGLSQGQAEQGPVYCCGCPAGGTAASFPFGCRPPGECCEVPDQSSVAPVHGFSGQVIPTSVGGGKMGVSSNSWEPRLPRVLISVLCVCLLTAHTCCCGFQKFLVLNTWSLSKKDLHMSSTPGERRSRAHHISLGCLHHQLLVAPEPPALGTGDAGRERLSSWAK